jgi:AcrR family transcriptional regulator
MVLLYHIGYNNSTKVCSTIVDMEVPYLHTGRISQKARTRDALIAAARQLLARGITPTVEGAAAEASIGRTTAYRYFPNSRALLAATYPEIEMRSLLGADPPEDPLARLEIVVESQTQRIVEYEPEYRAQLRLALEGQPAGSESLPLRRGRRIEWVEDALAPLHGRMPERELRRLIYGIGATLGIEALVWLTDMGGLSREEAVDVMRSNACMLLRSALDRLE